MLGSGRTLLASDFDGTLSRLVMNPWSARIIPAAQRALRRLAVRPDLHVALISGRTVVDLADRARVGGISYRGDHGAEWAEAPRGFRRRALQVEQEPTTEAEAAVAARLAAEVPRSIREAWLVVEPKAAALTFHFRGAPDVDAARARVVVAVDAVDADELLARSVGSRSLELRPRSASTKGDALERLITWLQPRAVVMLGDDRNDALAFDVVRATRAAGGIDGLAIAVAGHADVTTAVAPRADLVLRSPDEAARLLSLLAAA